MTDRETSQTQADPRCEAFIRCLLDKAARQRLPELFTGEHPDALYYIRNRNGVSVIALRTPSLSQDQLIKIMTYRLAQYVAINFVDARMVYEAGMEHEPLSSVSKDEVNVIAGSAETGQILCYMAIKGGVDAPLSMKLRTPDRPLFPVEKLFGWGIYNRLKILPDLPLARVRELGRFVKNQRLDPLNELVSRAPVETGVALFRLLIGPLREEIEACIGDIEEGVAKKNMDFFYVPLVVIHGVVPYAEEDAYLWPHVQSSTVYPFAFLVSDLSVATQRLGEIERALDQPGKQGLIALLALKRDLQSAESSLEPPEGLAPLTDAVVPQKGVPMQARRRWLDMGEWLRTTNLFSSLSSAEAAVLGTFMERRAAAAGDITVRQGEAGDDLYLIEAGQAKVQIRSRTGQPVTVATLGPGDYFGEIALVTGGQRTADVIARTPMTLLRLTNNAYSQYLAHMVEVENRLTRTALSRIKETLKTMNSSDV